MPSPQSKLTPGYKGATVLSYDENAPRVFVAKLMAEWPLAGRDEICRRVETALRGRYEKYLSAFIQYATINAYNAVREGEKSAMFERVKPIATGEATATISVSALTSSASPVPVPVRTVLTPAQVQEREVERTQTKTEVKRVLLNLVAPDGRLWRELSIAEYMTFGKKQLDHGQRMLSAGHKRTELIATATTEAELNKVFG